MRPGYKQTEVGVIPRDWVAKPLGAIECIATGNTPPTRDVANYSDEFLFVSPVDLGDVKYISHTEKMLSRKGFAISRYFPKNSILFCIGSTIGKCGIASKELTLNQQINAIFPSRRLNSSRTLTRSGSGRARGRASRFLYFRRTIEYAHQFRIPKGLDKGSLSFRMSGKPSEASSPKPIQHEMSGGTSQGGRAQALRAQPSKGRDQRRWRGVCGRNPSRQHWTADRLPDEQRSETWRILLLVNELHQRL